MLHETLPGHRWGRPGGRRRGRARPDAEEARADAQLPGHRTRPLLAGDDRPGAAAVHRHRATTRSGRSAATSARGSTPRRRRRTTTPASGPTTTSSTCRATRSSSTAPSRRRCRTTTPSRSACPAPRCSGGPRGRAKAFRPDSLMNISGMSFGSMSGNAIQALNKGAKLAGCMHNTGEGGLSPHHRQGGDIVLQIGTAYFGCRDEHGNFSLAQAQGGRRVGSGARDRGQALAGSQAGSRWPAAGREGDQGDQRDPRHPDGPGLRQPVAAHRVHRRGQPARLRGADRRRDRPSRRDQVRRRGDGASGTS